jgi:hypothetical protein
MCGNVTRNVCSVTLITALMKLLIITLKEYVQEWLRPKQVSALQILMHYFLLRDAKLELLTPLLCNLQYYSQFINNIKREASITILKN